MDIFKELFLLGLLRGVTDIGLYCREAAEKINAKHVPEDLLQ